MDHIRIKHMPANRVHVLASRDSDNGWAELDIAESTWWKVSNGVSRILVGKAYVEGKRMKSYWSFFEDRISIMDNDDQILFRCNLSDVIESD